MSIKEIIGLLEVLRKALVYYTFLIFDHEFTTLCWSVTPTCI